MHCLHLTKAQSLMLLALLRSSEGVDSVVENQAYALGRRSRIKGRAVIRIESFIPIRPDEYAVREHYGVKLKPEALARVVAVARGHDDVILKFHRHPTADDMPIDHFSPSDDFADKQLSGLFGVHAPYFSVLLADLPDGDYRLITRTPTPSNDFVYLPTIEHRLPLRVHAPAHLRADSEKFVRTNQGFGAGIINNLSALHIGIVGCGGLGWRAALDLADSGVGGLSLFDFDKVELRNLPRLPGTTPADCGKLKIEVLAALLRQRYDDINIESHAVNVIDALDRTDDERQMLIDQLCSCDVLLLTTDNHPSRFLTMLVAERHHIPYVCSGMHPIGRADMYQDLGAFVPGVTRCGACYGLINPLEASKRGKKYIEGEPMPNVAAWNGVAAGNIANAVRMLAVPLGHEDLTLRHVWQIGLSEPNTSVLQPLAKVCEVCGAPVAGCQA